MPLKTEKNFLQEVRAVYRDEYTVISPYTKAKENILVRHEKCEEVFTIYPINFVRKGKAISSCPYCKGRKMTHKGFLKEVKDQVGDEYTVLSEFRMMTEHVMIAHNRCGYEYSVLPTNFIKGDRTRCPKCLSKRRKKHEDFLEEVKHLKLNEYTVIGTYKNNKTKIEMIHNICGNSFWVRPNDFLSEKSGCTSCSPNRPLTHSLFTQLVKDLVGNEYTVIGEYISSHKKILMQHDKCGLEYPVTPSKFIYGRRCPKCQGKYVREFLELVQEVQEKTNGEYRIISDGEKYEKLHSMLDFFHESCKRTFPMRAYSFLDGQRCPLCHESKGERLIRLWLEKNNVRYKQEYKFPDCRDKRPLIFDFAVFSGKHVAAVIEFDGLQHQVPIEHFGGEKALEDRRKKDKIKDNYCYEKTIKMIRIPFEQLESIPDILQQNLINKGANFISSLTSTASKKYKN